MLVHVDRSRRAAHSLGGGHDLRDPGRSWGADGWTAERVPSTGAGESAGRNGQYRRVGRLVGNRRGHSGRAAALRSGGEGLRGAHFERQGGAGGQGDDGGNGLVGGGSDGLTVAAADEQTRPASNKDYSHSRRQPAHAPSPPHGRPQGEHASS